MNWKITDLNIENNVLIGAHYFASLTDGLNTIETQGEWKFSKPHSEILISDLEEKLVIRWIEEDASKEGVNIIKSNLEKQLQALKSEKSSLPWVKPTFKPNFGL